MIGAKPKGGKSTTCAELAISLWSSTPFLNHAAFPVRSLPAPVLYIQQENADHRVQHDFQRIAARRGLGTLIEERAHLHDDVYETYVDFEFDPNATADLPALRVLSQGGFDLSNAGHQEWLRDYVREHSFRYIFLDPLYMLVGATKVSDGGDELREYLSWLTALTAETGAACILTHHCSGKPNTATGPETLLGSTFIWGWYQAAIFTSRSTDHVFTFRVDALRDHGREESYTVAGTGVGGWMMAPGAQGLVDSTGRRATRTSQKEARKAVFVELEAEHPDWDYDRLAEEMGVTKRTLQRWESELTDAAGRDLRQRPLPDGFVNAAG